jgi:hypothetical protein
MALSPNLGHGRGRRFAAGNPLDRLRRADRPGVAAKPVGCGGETAMQRLVGHTVRTTQMEAAITQDTVPIQNDFLTFEQEKCDRAEP